MRDFLSFFGGLILFSAVGLMVILAGCLWVGNTISLGPNLAAIEQLRADAANVDPQQAEDVIGQVTEWNQTIARNHVWNDVWWAGWSVPDEWDEVEPIPVPRP